MNYPKMTVFPSSEGVVWKHVFDFGDAIAETVLYRYEERTVICCSVMCGCPVGCVFCGTGKQFKRNLTDQEILTQVMRTLYHHKIEPDTGRFQIMFMSMGEPLLNWSMVESAIKCLHELYPSAELLISTVGIKNATTQAQVLKTSILIPKVGLQFSIHAASDTIRNIIIPYTHKMSLREIRDYGLLWNRETGRPVYLNYCVSDEGLGWNGMERLKDLFPPKAFRFTFSVICEVDETLKAAGDRNLETAEFTANNFRCAGYNVRVFNPAGQDDIGGGCGQLWYTQEWFKKNS